MGQPWMCQGERLSCVIIDRLPFAVPNDPVVAARIRAIYEAEGIAFFEYQVPAAVISLKQGFGRLIRSVKDRGLLVLTLCNATLPASPGEPRDLNWFVLSKFLIEPFSATDEIADQAKFGFYE